MATNQLILAIHVLMAISSFHYAAADDALETLYYASVHGLESISNLDDRRIIQFWMNAGRVSDIEKCNVMYLRHLRDKFESDMKLVRMTNLSRVYTFAEFDLLSSCGVQVGELAEEVIRSLNVEQIRRLEGIVPEFDLWFSRETEGSFQFVAEGMMYLLGFERCLRKVDLLSAWYQGPCPTVLRKVNEKHALPLYDYVNLATETRVHPYDLGYDVSPSTKFAVSMIRYCDYFRWENSQTEAWDALQTSESYQRIKSHYALLNNQVNRN